MVRTEIRNGGALLGAALALAGCSREQKNLGALKEALAHGDAAALGAATREAPTCPAAPVGTRAPAACLADIATWLGSKKGFQFGPPDQAAAGTAALVIARDGRGEWLPGPEAWRIALRAGEGAGADVLRLAVSEKMAEKLSPLARPLSTDDDARALMRAVASSVPGACETYARLGAGEEATAGPPELTAEHSPCVQKDLERSMGPKEHGQYGEGLWRGAEGALALAWDVATALRQGVGSADAAVRGTIDANVARVTAALQGVVTKKLSATPAQEYAAQMSDTHADAGMPVTKTPVVPLLPVPGGSPPAPRGRKPCSDARGGWVCRGSGLTGSMRSVRDSVRFPT